MQGMEALEAKREEVLHLINTIYALGCDRLIDGTAII